MVKFSKFTLKYIYIYIYMLYEMFEEFFSKLVWRETLYHVIIFLYIMKE